MIQYSGRNLSMFLETADKIRHAERSIACFIDSNGIAMIWEGNENDMGDCPGRSFGLNHCIMGLIKRYPEDSEDYFDLESIS